jgi:hypothetical protein
MEGTQMLEEFIMFGVDELLHEIQVYLAFIDIVRGLA